jgi:hypothetical protein
LFNLQANRRELLSSSSSSLLQSKLSSSCCHHYCYHKEQQHKHQQHHTEALTPAPASAAVAMAASGSDSNIINNIWQHLLFPNTFHSHYTPLPTDTSHDGVAHSPMPFHKSSITDSKLPTGSNWITDSDSMHNANSFLKISGRCITAVLSEACAADRKPLTCDP